MSEAANGQDDGHDVYHESGLTRRSVTLPDELWKRIKTYRHEHHLDKFSDAFRKVVEAGLAAVEAMAAPPPPERKRKGSRRAAKLLAWLIVGACTAGWWESSTAEVIRAEAAALDYVVLSDNVYDVQAIVHFIADE